MKLLRAFLSISAELQGLFPQVRSGRRAQRLCLSTLLCLGRKWITGLIGAANREQRDWSADYKLFSRCRWQNQQLFIPVLCRGLQHLNSHEPIVVAGDETKTPRAGRRVRRSTWLRDPLSPPFHVNLMRGIRWVQFAMILPLHRRHKVSARSIPVSFEPIDIPRKPRKSAPTQEHEAYRKARRLNNMSRQSVRQLQTLRRLYDQAGASARLLLAVLDGGFCNRTVFRAKLDRTARLARCRKDAKLCFPAHDPQHPHRRYTLKKFTPEQVRQDATIPWQKKSFFLGGRKRPVRFKQITGVLWQRGSGLLPLRLIVIAPIPYRLSAHAPLDYRQPAYLLTDELSLSVEFLLQAYLDRWQIEVNHRDEKQHLGIADAQVWNDQSVDHVPAFMVAAYAFLLLASLDAYGAKRTEDYIQPPKWQRRRTRPSCQDLLRQFRKEAFAHPHALQSLEILLSPEAAGVILFS
jgi:hypothetical protein